MKDVVIFSINSFIASYKKGKNKRRYETKKSFDRAFTEVSSIKTVANNIQDAKQKKEASEIIRFMEKRNHLYHSYYKEYIDVLTLNQDLYKQLAKQKYKVSKLEKKIEKVNQDYTHMKDQKQQFNRYTQKYNKAKEQYYKEAGLKTRH